MIDKFKKQNALINAFTSDKIVYKEIHHDLLNLFMGIIQKQYLDGNKFISTINITKELISKYITYSEKHDIYPFIQELALIQYKFTNNDMKRINEDSPSFKLEKGFFNFITAVSYGESADKRGKIFKITFNNELFSFLLDNNYCIDKGHYTIIRHEDISMLNSKYQKMLGEIILSNRFKKDFDLSYEFLREKFNILDKPFAYLGKILKRQLPILQDKFLDFNYEMHKKDKKLTINIKDIHQQKGIYGNHP